MMNRYLVVLATAALLSACYQSPEFAQGTPCSIDGACPAGQFCASDNRCYDDGAGPDGGAESGARLAGLTVSIGELEPAFSPELTDYTLRLGLGSANVSITAEAEADETIAVAGASIESGSAFELRLDVGKTSSEIVVASAAGETTYTIDIARGEEFAQSAYIKPSNTGFGFKFGGVVAMSGNTVVIADEFESSSATGVNGDQLNGGATNSGAVYVFSRSGTSLTQEAYLKASNTDQSDLFGTSVAIDGDTIVVGAPAEDSAATEINGDQADNSVGSVGAAYVFRRINGQWAQEAYLKPSNSPQSGSGIRFGQAVAISADTIVVGASNEASAATGVNGDQSDRTAFASGAAYVFTRNGATWSQRAYIKASNTNASDRFGSLVALSGNTLAVSAPSEGSSASGINGDQLDNSLTQAGAVYVFTGSGSSWDQQAYIKASNTEQADGFGRALSLQGDILIVGSPFEDSAATGTNGSQGDNSRLDSGALYSYRRSGSVWQQTSYIKPSNTDASDSFGASIALDGDLLVVGARREGSGATGVGGEQQDNGADSAGAVYIFAESSGAWQQVRYVKASNTDADDRFGDAVASDDGVVVVGAGDEKSSARGVGADQADNTLRSGAAYLFD